MTSDNTCIMGFFQLKVEMKCFFIAEIETTPKIGKIAVYRFLRCFDTIQSLCRGSRSVLVCIQEIDPELISSLQNSILSFIFEEFGGGGGCFAKSRKESKK